MRPQDIVIGNYYRHRNSPTYAYAKAIEILKPKTGINTNTFQVVKCEWTINKGDNMGFIKYFRPSDLVKE